MSRRKNFYLLLILLLAISSCSTPAENNVAVNVTENVAGEFDWLLGNWERTNDQKMQQTYENWSKVNETAYAGFGCTLNLGDTIWSEKIVLILTHEGWFFHVTDAHKNKTIFTVTKQVPFQFTCENPENDFPKKIQYTLDGQFLNAEISGGNAPVQFNFKKVETDIYN